MMKILQPKTWFTTLLILALTTSGLLVLTTIDPLPARAVEDNDIDKSMEQKEQPPMPMPTQKAPQEKSAQPAEGKNPDTRTRVSNVTQNPFKQTIKIDSYFKNGGGGGCTASMLKDNFLLTNAHCVWNKEKGAVSNTWVRGGVVDGKATLGTQPAQGTLELTEGTNLFINTSYKQKQDFSVDYALIYLGQDRTIIDKTGYINLSTTTPQLGDYHRSIGFPGKINYEKTPANGAMMTAEGKVKDVNTGNGTIHSSTVVSWGQSGGLFTNRNNEQIGIISIMWLWGDENWTSGGPYFTPTLTNQLTTWKNTAHTEANKNGWITENGKKYYLKNGTKLTGRHVIDGKPYYFYDNGVDTQGSLMINDRVGVWINGKHYVYQSDRHGVLVSGVAKEPAKWGERYHFFDPQTNFQDDSQGWKTYDSKRYYITDRGNLATGRQIIDGKPYYFYDNGVAPYASLMLNFRVGVWVNGDHYVYQSDRDGVLVSGVAEDNTPGGKGTYNFFDPRTNYQDKTQGWKAYDSKRYYFKQDPKGWGLVRDGRHVIDGKPYWFGSDGELYINRWIYNNDKWYRASGDGSLYSNGSYYIDGNWWKFNSNAEMYY